MFQSSRQMFYLKQFIFTNVLPCSHNKIYWRNVKQNSRLNIVKMQVWNLTVINDFNSNKNMNFLYPGPRFRKGGVCSGLLLILHITIQGWNEFLAFHGN